MLPLLPKSRISGIAAQVALVSLMAVACMPKRATSHRIVIRGFTYLPATFAAAVGDTVIWLNEDLLPHTVTDSLRRFDSGELASGETWRFVAASTGTHSYVCAFHPSMRATFVVR